MNQGMQIEAGVWYRSSEVLPPRSGVYLLATGIYVFAMLWDNGEWSTVDRFQERAGPEGNSYWALLPTTWREHAALVEAAERLDPPAS